MKIPARLRRRRQVSDRNPPLMELRWGRKGSVDRKREMASFELAEKGGIFGGGFGKCRGWIVKDGKFGGGCISDSTHSRSLLRLNNFECHGICVMGSTRLNFFFLFFHPFPLLINYLRRLTLI